MYPCFFGGVGESGETASDLHVCSGTSGETVGKGLSAAMKPQVRPTFCGGDGCFRASGAGSGRSEPLRWTPRASKCYLRSVEELDGGRESASPRGLVPARGHTGRPKRPTEHRRTPATSSSRSFARAMPGPCLESVRTLPPLCPHSAHAPRIAPTAHCAGGRFSCVRRRKGQSP